MMDSSTDVLLKLKDSIRIFASDRNWDQFHTPKNLASTKTMIQIAMTKEIPANGQCAKRVKPSFDFR
jgi:hypothetical protein